MIVFCRGCGKPLTDEERNYYEFRCEACERYAHDEIVRWRLGEDNERLDAMFTVKQTIH